jgi:hypothetical protein
MTYRERRERRAERLRDWAEKRRQKSAASFTRAHTIADGIPFGQPILVGHHSERHARRDQDRIHRAMTAGLEHQHKAASMASRAAEIDRQADRAIYDDDPDAIARLRDRIEAINKEIRRGDGWSARIEPSLTEQERDDLTRAARFSGCKGYPSYELQNLGGNLTKQRARLAVLVARAATTEQEPTV